MSEWMQMALQLAAEWKGRTSPNPMVGAVVVKDGRIVGKGAHRKAGEPHAEVHALRDAGEEAVGSTLYVTLEPCSHYGKTPPCTEQIIAGGVRKVVAAMVDPNPLVAGRGIARLRGAGIAVEVGDCAEEAMELNEAFVKYITTRMPFVTLKAAVSLDGKIAAGTGDSKWISNGQARRRVHELRQQADAVLVGRGTVESDNPRLDVRLPDKVRDPQKIILTTQLMEPKVVRNLAAYQLSKEKPLIMVGVKERVKASRVAGLAELGVDVILLPLKKPSANHPLTHTAAGDRTACPADAEGVDIRLLLLALGERRITSLLLEGGSGVYSQFVKAGLIDRVALFQAPVILGEDGISWLRAPGVRRVEDALRLRKVRYTCLGDNILTEGYWNHTDEWRDRLCSQELSKKKEP